MREFINIVSGNTPSLLEGEQDTLLETAISEALEAAYALGQQNAVLDESATRALKNTVKGLALGAAALASSHASAAPTKPSYDPMDVAASGDTSHSKRAIPDTGSKDTKSAKPTKAKHSSLVLPDLEQYKDVDDLMKKLDI